MARTHQLVQTLVRSVQDGTARGSTFREMIRTPNMPAFDGLALADCCARYAGVLAWLRRRCAAGVTILMYHKVLPASAASVYPLRNLVVDLDAFDRQMAWLAANFEVVTVSEAASLLHRGVDRRRARPLACVTFDDGYRDNAEHAAPILGSHGLRGTFFITTGFIEGEPLWFDRAAVAWRSLGRDAVLRGLGAIPGHREQWARMDSFDAWWDFLKGLTSQARACVLDLAETSAVRPAEIFGAMNPEQVAELSRQGHEIGSHAVTHPILTTLDDSTLRWEMEASRERIRDWTGIPAAGFCYPNGDHDERVVAAARNAGYEYGCVLQRGISTSLDNRMMLPRRGILSSQRHDMTNDSFEAEVVGWHDMLRESRRKIFPRWALAQ